MFRDWKQAIDESTKYACYDFPPLLIAGSLKDGGHINLLRESKSEGKLYHINGTIGGARYYAQSSEEGLPRMLEELTIDPRRGWYSL